MQKTTTKGQVLLEELDLDSDVADELQDDFAADKPEMTEFEKEKAAKIKAVKEAEMVRKDTWMRKQPKEPIRVESIQNPQKHASVMRRMDKNDEITNAGLRQA